MLTAVVLTRNEEKGIVDCLQSLSFCDQIIVIDDNSIDSTVSLARKHGAKVYTHSLAGDFSAQRNFALSKVTTDWVLFIDADEQVSPKLAQEIHSLLQQPDTSSCQGYLIPRLDYLWGQILYHGDTGHVSLLRLGRTGSGVWQGIVHETWQVKGKVGSLASPILHYPHKTIALFLSHINFYSTLRAQELVKTGHRGSLLEIVLYPPMKFFHLWIIKRGFLDGTAGLIHAMLMAFYTFLVRGKRYLS